MNELDTPIFHADQHAVAIMIITGLINALKMVKKDWKDLKIVVSSAGINYNPDDIILVNTKKNSL